MLLYTYNIYIYVADGLKLLDHLRAETCLTEVAREQAKGAMSFADVGSEWYERPVASRAPAAEMKERCDTPVGF